MLKQKEITQLDLKKEPKHRLKKSIMKYCNNTVRTYTSLQYNSVLWYCVIIDLVKS